MTTPTLRIIPIRLPLVSVYLIGSADHWIIVDSGAPGDGPAILRTAAQHGIATRAIRLILLTHGHVDHFGAAAALREATSAPIALHAADLPYVRAGANPDALRALDLEGRILRPFLPWKASPVEPDLIFDQPFDLNPYGVDAQTLHTPGHSPGHIALPLPDGSVIVGDLLRGGFMGGRIAAHRPLLPFFASDLAQLQASLAQILTLPSHTIYVGHGGPLATAQVRTQFGALLATQTA